LWVSFAAAKIPKDQLLKKLVLKAHVKNLSYIDRGFRKS